MEAERLGLASAEARAPLSPGLGTPQTPRTTAPTPHFQLCPTQLRHSLGRMQAAFPSASIFYAMKANPEAAVLTELADAGANFEVASLGEYRDLVAACPRLSADRVIFGTSVKPAAAIRELHEAGVDRMAADSEGELRKIAAMAPGTRVIIRVVADARESVFSMSEKFGARRDEAGALLRAAADMGLEPHGLSFNVGSQATEAGAWGRAVSALAAVVRGLQKDGIRLSVLNIGGGFPHEYAEAGIPSVEEIARDVHAALAELPYRVQLVLEPGRALVAPAVDLYTSVVARARRGGREWLYLDAGVYNALFEALRCQGTTRYSVELCDRVRAEAESWDDFVLAGPTGDGLDVINEQALLPADVGVGDVLRVKACGAYTSSLASRFNGFEPAPTVVHGLDSVCDLCDPSSESSVPMQRTEAAS